VSGRPLLAVDGLTVSYGAVAAVRDMSFTVSSGQTFAVLGANGAGKSSLLKALLGWERPARGRVHLDGQDITAWPPWRRGRAGLAAVPEGGRVFADLTIAENLAMGAYGQGARPSEEQVRAACRDFPAIAERLGERAGDLSGGQQQMVAIARALIAQPRLLVVDEVTSGLAPKLVAQVFAALAELPGRGITLLVAEQNARRALEIADHALVMSRGQAVLSGLAAELLGDTRLLDAYLGAR
jgi:branched-chain amino acid transport system ATP-binding protein